MSDAHYRDTVRRIARMHAEWVDEDTTLRHAKMNAPVEALARALVAQIDQRLNFEMTRIERESLERQRHNLAGVIQLTTTP